jgi:ribosome maturation factor RimP
MRYITLLFLCLLLNTDAADAFLCSRSYFSLLRSSLRSQTHSELDTDLDTDWKNKVEGIIQSSIVNDGLAVSSIVWHSERLEVIVASNDSNNESESEGGGGANSDTIEKAHRNLYHYLELDQDDISQNALANYEILVASPGLSDSLTRDYDFVAFKGFPVSVETSVDVKGKTVFQGTLMERNDENVVISVKGRLVKIPRDTISQIYLPKSLHEAGDHEIKKLSRT